MIKRLLKEQAGFTLIEMLIVVILLGILAMLIIPQISVSTADANMNTLQTNLASMRNAIELYYHQHNEAYPGRKKTDGTGTDTAAADLPAAFIDQLTKYTDINGGTSNIKDAAHPFGPYLKSQTLPMNPFNSKTDVVCDIIEDDITVRNSTASDNGWKFYVITGVFIAADGTAGVHDNL
jgi:prepilin-type N-terminal cleavage/methylation domain-containing protein